jgi:sulfate/thiosulfate transport system ATP-binding protein
MITISNARKSFGQFAALDDVSLEIPTGSLTALLGPSGSGKSTLLRAIAGLDNLDSGVVTIGGRDVTRVLPQQRGIGFVFQHYAAFKHMTVRDNVAFGLSIRRRPKAEITRRVDDLLAIVGLEGFQHRYPAQLSGGQRQRMALARALAVDPKVLLLDEPFGALDAKVRAELRSWLRRLHSEVHVTTVLVTHDQEEALDIADRIALLNHGRIEQVGAPDDLYDRPANEFVMSFVGSVARLNGHLVRPHDIVLERRPQEPLSAVRAVVTRVVRLGFEVRVALRDDAGHEFSAQLTRGDIDALAVSEGDVVWARSTRPSPLSAAGDDSTGAVVRREPHREADGVPAHKRANEHEQESAVA